MVIKINKSRFNAFAMFSRDPILEDIAEEIEYYSNIDATILGAIILDYIDFDFTSIIFCRDENGKFKAIDVSRSFTEINSARAWLIDRIDSLTKIGKTIEEQGDTNKGIQLFEIIVKDEKIHPYFKRLDEDLNYLPAKKILIEISKHFEDIDGNFVEQFQTYNGFDSRLWELYLFCFLREENCTIKRDYNRPDFLIEKYGKNIAIEAVIVDRKVENPPKYVSDYKEKKLEYARLENENNMPLRFASPLFSKLSKNYWELPQVNGMPLVFAIADFHEEMSMTWSFTSLSDYLFGIRYNYFYNDKNELILNPEKINPYKKQSGVEIEPGYFFIKDAGIENVSAVLFSSTATLSKFTRIGIQAGFKEGNITVFRAGANYNHDPNAAYPDMFQYVVNENSEETWAEGLNLFHNPFARYPIDKKIFPSIAHHELIEDKIISYIPEFHPYFSYNFSTVFE